MQLLPHFLISNLQRPESGDQRRVHVPRTSGTVMFQLGGRNASTILSLCSSSYLRPSYIDITLSIPRLSLWISSPQLVFTIGYGLTLHLVSEGGFLKNQYRGLVSWAAFLVAKIPPLTWIIDHFKINLLPLFPIFVFFYQSHLLARPSDRNPPYSEVQVGQAPREPKNLH